MCNPVSKDRQLILVLSCITEIVYQKSIVVSMSHEKDNSISVQLAGSSFRSFAAVGGLNHSRVRGEQKQSIEDVLGEDIDDIELNEFIFNVDFMNVTREERELKLQQAKDEVLKQLKSIKKKSKDGDCEEFKEFEECLNNFIDVSEKEISTLNCKLQAAADYAAFWYQDVLKTGKKLQTMCHELNHVLSKYSCELYDATTRYKDVLYQIVGKWILEKDNFHHVTVSQHKWPMNDHGISWNIRSEVPRGITHCRHLFKSPWLNVDCMGWWQCKWEDCNRYNRIMKSTTKCNHCGKINHWREEQYQENDLDKWWW